MKNYIFSFAILTLVPLAGFAQTTPAAPPATNSGQTFQAQGDGIFNCNQTGSYAMSVGALSAVGGVYVPVNDAAVTLNTGYLVYKECVLRSIVSKQREAVSSGITVKTIQQGQTGRGGRPQYVEDKITEEQEESDRVVLLYEKRMQARNVDPAVIRAVKRTYVNENYSPSYTSCPYQDNGSIWNTLLVKVADQRCNPLGQYYIERSGLESARATALGCLRDELRDGRGFYAVKETDPNSLCAKVLTPSSVVQESFQTALDSPLRQLENADDIGEIISPLYSSLTTQALGDLKGLAGLVLPQGGQPSYLDRMAQEASLGLRTAALNAAIQILNSARNIETNYLAAKTTLANAMTRTIANLRTAERQCWELIIPKVCSNALTPQNTCATADGSTLQVATTTTASQTVITAQISPVALQVASEIKVSEEAVRLIETLVLGVTNTNSVTAQRLALEQLDSLVAQKKLHNQNDLTQAQKQRDDATNILNTLLQDTVKSWADSTDPNIGWCNVNNQAVVDLWKTRWKK